MDKDFKGDLNNKDANKNETSFWAIAFKKNPFGGFVLLIFALFFIFLSIKFISIVMSNGIDYAISNYKGLSFAFGLGWFFFLMFWLAQKDGFLKKIGNVMFLILIISVTIPVISKLTSCQSSHNDDYELPYYRR